jgi:hypothetical protein
MSYCTPCPPCDTNFPLLCEPLETTANGKRLVVEDSAACQKTIQSPVAQQVLKTDGAGNLTWTNGANSTVLGKDSTGKVEFATINSVLQSSPVDLGSQPLTTTGTATVGSIISSGNIAITTSGDITTTGTLNVGSIEVGNTTNAYIDFKSPASEDYDMRVGTLDGLNGYVTTKVGQNIKIYAPSADVHIQSDAGNRVGIGTTAPTEKLEVIGNIKASGSGNFQTIEVGNTSPGVAFIDIKSPTLDDFDLRLTTDGTNGIIKSFGNIYIEPAPSKSIAITNISTYANNAAAVTGGLIVNSVYKTATGELRIVV